VGLLLSKASFLLFLVLKKICSGLISGSGESAKVIQDLEMNLKDALAYIEQEKLQSQELLTKLQSQELRANQL